MPTDSRPILLVEDTRLQALMVRGLLETGGVGYEVVHVVTLAEALARMRTQRFACVLLDLTLPDATGLDGVVALRNEAPEVALIVVTADEDEVRAVKAVQLGAQDHLVKGQLSSQLLARSVYYAIERNRAELKLAHQALHDPLTGLPNRALFMDRLALALAKSERRASSVALLFVDLDGFKAVNDSYGHAVGDRVLRSVAGRLVAILRPGDTVARYGGDEFTIVGEEVAGIGDAVSIARRVTESLAHGVDLEGRDIALAASIGVALSAGLSERPDALIDRADRAMYSAKRAGSAHGVAPDPDVPGTTPPR